MFSHACRAKQVLFQLYYDFKYRRYRMSDDYNADLTTSDVDSLLDLSIENSYREAGLGSYFSRFMMTLSKFDRFGYTGLIPNDERAGFTFITRPTLNFTTTNLLQDRIMSTLNIPDSLSLPLSIRAYLDPQWADKYLYITRACPFYNQNSPFLIPLSNRLIDAAGFPDMSIDTVTTDSGFFNEDQTIARGSDMNNRTYDVSMTFNEIQGGYIFGIFLYWLRYMALVTSLGIMFPYQEYIEHRRLDYTVSIYRFTLDSSRRYIIKWSKCTGCFPTGLPSGNMFNINQSEFFNRAAATFNINFKVNHFEFMDPIILNEFNWLVRTFCPDVTTSSMVNSETKLFNNFTGVPYIDVVSGRNELVFKAYKEEVEDVLSNRITNAMSSLNSIKTNAINTALLDINNNKSESFVDINSIPSA